MMGANILAAWQEAYHWRFVYGNISKNSTSKFPLHFAEDSDDGMADRLGTLYFYNNTWWMTGPVGYGGVTALQVMFDTSGGPVVPNNYEFQQVQAANNIVWTASTGLPCWNVLATMLPTFTTNLLNTNWTALTDGIPGSATTQTVTDPVTNAINRFYRLKVTMP